VLQQMRGLAKYIWVLVALVFVGGFLLYETSGLMGRTPVTPTTAVAVVNGREIPYREYIARVQNEIQAAQQRERRTLSQDDNRRIENTIFDQMVNEVLLQSEYRRRGIVVTDDEVREFARYAPPPWITSAPELQTEGRFDPEKYQRLLASAQARQSGLLLQLEAYYRSEIPREKLFDQVASGVYVTDAELWRAWRDQHDSAQVSYVAFSPSAAPAATGAIPESDLRSYFDQHKSEFQSPGRAILSVVTIPKLITAADTAAARAHADTEAELALLRAGAAHARRARRAAGAELMATLAFPARVAAAGAVRRRAARRRSAAVARDEERRDEREGQEATHAAGCGPKARVCATRARKRVTFSPLQSGIRIPMRSASRQRARDAQRQPHRRRAAVG
jgi:hypothetical protein